MNLTVNGKPYTHNGVGSIAALASELKAPLDKVAVLVNNDVVPRKMQGAVSLKEGDRIEIITMAGGG